MASVCSFGGCAVTVMDDDLNHGVTLETSHVTGDGTHAAGHQGHNKRANAPH